MIKTDESALICDLAETYHIYDYRSLPLKVVATFSVGLRENSRIKMALANVKYPFETMLLAAILDGINFKNWLMCKGAREGINRPQTMVGRLLGKQEEYSQEGDSDVLVFDSGKVFEEMRRKLLEGDK